jgi:hypothetical protein
MLFRVDLKKSLRETETYRSVVARGVEPADCLPQRFLPHADRLRLSV